MEPARVREKPGEKPSLTLTRSYPVAPEKVWRAWTDAQALKTIVFKAAGNGTELEFRHEQLFDEKVRDDHKSGWSTSLDKLERFLQSPN
jgi:uncharacterized protein YndB with AHSA1/START domain